MLGCILWDPFFLEPSSAKKIEVLSRPKKQKTGREYNITTQSYISNYFWHSRLPSSMSKFWSKFRVHSVVPVPVVCAREVKLHTPAYADVFFSAFAAPSRRRSSLLALNIFTKIPMDSTLGTSPKKS